MSDDLKQKLTRPSIWLRLITMIVLAIAFNIAEIVIFAVVIFQFLATLFTGEPNAHFIRFGRSLGRYLQQIVAFMTFTTEEKPFPFSSWPDEPQEEPPVMESQISTDRKAEEAGTAPENGGETKPKRPASRKAATRKPRTPPKKDS